MPQVERVFYVSQEQAYSEFKQDFSNQQALGQADRAG